MRTIDTVLFDLDDTLHDDTTAYRGAAREVAQALAREHSIDAAVVCDAYERGVSAFWSGLSADQLDRGIAAERERMWYEALRAAGLDDRGTARDAAAAYGRARSGALALFPGASELLTTLRARGCKLGLVTNGFAETHHDKIDRLGLRDLIDAFFLADEVGMVKPDPELFRHACRVLGSTPDRAAMVGDRYGRDVVGAHEAGLFTVLLDVHAVPIPAASPRPDAIVGSIGEVLSALAPLGLAPAAG
ncbi:MAG TPA: HAD family hydrolase [Candidatus Elarobacter sp.]|jgi:putative hydrolase of the HAD superfamily|nr:HAD family hydrolase [Candidatus Elarobacter sp.]